MDRERVAAELLAVARLLVSEDERKRVAEWGWFKKVKDKVGKGLRRIVDRATQTKVMKLLAGLAAGGIALSTLGTVKLEKMAERAGIELSGDEAFHITHLLEEIAHGAAHLVGKSRRGSRIGRCAACEAADDRRERSIQELRERVEKAPRLIYRGLATSFNNKQYEKIKKWLSMPMEMSERGQHYKIGPFVIRHLEKKHGGIGVHWSTREGMAETAARVRGNVSTPNNLSMVLTAVFDKDAIGWDVEDISGLGSEDEIPLKKGSRVKIKDIRLMGSGISRPNVLKSPMVGTV